MSGMFGGSNRASSSNTEAISSTRQQTQRVNENAGRSVQKAERGAGKSRGRNFLLGLISNGNLKTQLGG